MFFGRLDFPETTPQQRFADIAERGEIDAGLLEQLVYMVRRHGRAGRRLRRGSRRWAYRARRNWVTVHGAPSVE
jgi:hypothetical protein